MEIIKAIHRSELTIAILSTILSTIPSTLLSTIDTLISNLRSTDYFLSRRLALHSVTGPAISETSSTNEFRKTETSVQVESWRFARPTKASDRLGQPPRPQSKDF
jgi:hypothetical protein